ncbi:MAG: folate-binding protein, partial [Actinomycetota bacterium]
FGVDATGDDLPQEAGLAAAVSFDKGCYLGQESVAKVQNLGHPRRVLLSIETGAKASPGDPVLADGDEVGRITSAVAVGDQTHGFASVRWAARNGPFTTNEGAELRARPLP